MFRRESGRCVATLVRVLGDVDLAEDAVQEAFALALVAWPRDGLPDRPGAWITTTARNRAVDRIRRADRGRTLQREVAVSDHRPEELDLDVLHPVRDDLLRLVFAACHPALSPDAQVALTLRLVAGLDTDQVARAFLVSTPTMAQRLVRAKRKIREAHLPYRVPDDDLRARLGPVLAVVALTFNAEGEDLRDVAIHLARTLADLLPDEPEVLGLLALLLLTEARWPARRDPAGNLVLLRDQDRSRWDHDLVAEGQQLVRTCLRHDQPGPWQLQAAINAVHTDAPTFADTDWHQVVVLYDQLRAVAPSPVVDLNRAIAIGEVDGPAVALALVDDLDLDGYQPWYATRADLLHRLDRTEEARSAYARAADLADDPAVARHLRRRRDDLS